MIPIDKCRELIENDEEYTDEEILKIRDTLEQLADLAFDMWLEEINKKSS